MCRFPVMEELVLYFYLLEEIYRQNSNEFPLISGVDIKCFMERMTDLSNNGSEVTANTLLYDPIMEPLVQSALAHFLFMKKNNLETPDIKAYHPNYLRFAFLDKLIANKASVTLGSFKLYEITPSTASMERGKLMQKVDDLLLNRTLKALVESFVKKLQVDRDRDPLERILGFVQTKKKPTRGLGLLYFILMDLYLEYIDSVIYETIYKSGLNCFWGRCLDTAILGFTEDKKTVQYHDILQLHIVLPAWGLTAKVRSGSKGGRVIRPWNGKLYINKEGHLQWVRPESIIEM